MFENMYECILLLLLFLLKNTFFGSEWSACSTSGAEHSDPSARDGNCLLTKMSSCGDLKKTVSK